MCIACNTMTMDKNARIVMEINVLLFDMNSIELLLLKIKPNNGEDLW